MPFTDLAAPTHRWSDWYRSGTFEIVWSTPSDKGH